MTIENAEKIEPCAWCGKTPKRSPNGYCICSSENECLMWDYLLALEPEGWNALMTGLLARRRADYIEGCRAADAVAYYEPFDVEASADAYLSQPPADGEA